LSSMKPESALSKRIFSRLSPQRKSFLEKLLYARLVPPLPLRS